MYFLIKPKDEKTVFLRIYTVKGGAVLWMTPHGLAVRPRRNSKIHVMVDSLDESGELVKEGNIFIIDGERFLYAEAWLELSVSIDEVPGDPQVEALSSVPEQHKVIVVLRDQ